MATFRYRQLKHQPVPGLHKRRVHESILCGEIWFFDILFRFDGFSFPRIGNLLLLPNILRFGNGV